MLKSEDMPRICYDMRGNKTEFVPKKRRLPNAR